MGGVLRKGRGHISLETKVWRHPYHLAFCVTWNHFNEAFLQQSDLGYSPDNVHLIGHSLGSHVAGEAGKRTFGAIGRITGWFNSKF